MKEKFDIEQLGEICDGGRRFYNKYETFESAWVACERGDWMLYIAAKLKIDIRTLTLAKAHCANTVRHLMKDERSIKAVDIAIAYGEGRATEDEINNAYNDTLDIRAYIYDDTDYKDYNIFLDNIFWDKAYASDAAYYAVKYVDYDNAYDVDSVAESSAYAQYYAYKKSYDQKSARKENEKLTADICRKYLTEYVLEKIKEYDCENL